MDLDTFRPTFLIQIEGQDLSKDITQEITSFVFTDNEEELDVLELSVTDRNLQFVDDPLFQEGNEIVARFGYVGNLSPRKKDVVEHKANNASTPERTALGKQTYLVDGNTGEGSFKEQETGQIVPSFDRSEGFHEEPRQEPAQDSAEGKFREAELRQVEADAATIGIPQLRAKKNVEIKGVGRKFSGIYYCHSVRHSISGAGYLCELKWTSPEKVDTYNAMVCLSSLKLN